MTNTSKRTLKKRKGGRTPGLRRRRVRIKPHKGPFQLELPLQMPLFPMQTVASPSSTASSLPQPANSSSLPQPAEPTEAAPAPTMLPLPGLSS